MAFRELVPGTESASTRQPCLTHRWRRVHSGWIHGDTTVESLEADGGRAVLLFPANHRSTSDRSHPPETCLPGNRPLFVQRKRVDRLTPTTRRTSAVLILWSSDGRRSEF